MKSTLSLCLAVAALGLGCRHQLSSSGVAIDGVMRTFVWPEATVLAGADLRSLKTSTLYQRYANKLDLPLFKEASEKLGFDLRRDLNRLLFESDGRRSLVLGEGAIRSEQMTEKLTALGGVKTKYHSYVLWGNEQNSLAILKNSTAIAGTGPDVRSALDLRESGAAAVAGELESLKQTLPAGAQLWILDRTGLPLTGMPLRPDLQSALSNVIGYITATAAGLYVNDGLKLQAQLTCVSPAGAQRVHDALRGGIGLARLTTKDDQAELLKIYDAVEVNRAGNLVKVDATFTGSEVDMVVASLPQAATKAERLKN